MEFIQCWLKLNYQWLLDISVTLFIAWQAHYFSKKLSAKEKLEHKERIKRKADEHILRIKKENLRSKVYHVNVNRYFKDYPSNVERIGGYSTIAAEIKSTHFDGVEFFCSMFRGVYKKDDGSLTFFDLGNDKKVFSVIPVGLVPYDWIEHIDLDGDEFEHRPLFFSHFKGPVFWSRWRRRIPFGYPYKCLKYYRKKELVNGDTYWVLVEDKISNG
jgi:hypothetical protein